MKLPLTNYNSVICCCSVAKWCLTLCDPMDCSTPGLPVLHYLPQFSQTRVHRVGDTIRPSHRLSSPSPPALNLSQLHGLFQWVSSSLWPDCHICTWLLTGKTISSVQFSHSVVSNSLQPHGLQHARLPCPFLSPRVSSDLLFPTCMGVSICVGNFFNMTVNWFLVFKFDCVHVRK